MRRRWAIPAVLVAVALAGLVATGPAPAGAAVESPGLTVQTDWLTGLDHPWDVGFPPTARCS